MGNASLAFWASLTLLIVCGALRAWAVTSRDGFTIDEGWHVVAGVSYVRTGDYRLNPEHPPLVKLWVGAALPERDFKLPPFRALVDKKDERDFTDVTIYHENDVDAVQRRTRGAMLALNMLLLFALGGALRSAFGPVLTLLTIGLLLVDPTVTAHLPVVLTDLPVALLACTAVVLASLAFRSWRVADLALASLTLGLVLSAKHSGLVTGVAVSAIGATMLLSARSLGARELWLRGAAVIGVLFGAYLVLWGFYGFRFSEGAVGQLGAGTLFNRSLEDKIQDLNSPTYRAVLELADRVRLVPRAYLWGLADVLRAGFEGREEVLYLFGHRLRGGDTPWYFFPAVLSAKLPLGALALSGAGALIVARRRDHIESAPALLASLMWGALFLVCLMRGNSGYAGVRHAMPVFPVLALLGAIALRHAWRSTAWQWRSFAGIAAMATLGSALPVMRPWEYYNELVGGSSEAWRFFTDDGLDNNQRTRELARYYDENVRGSGACAYDFYGVFREEKEARGLLFRRLREDALDTDVLSGFIFINARWLAPRPSYDYAVLRSATPRARFGNLLIFKGEYRVPWLKAAKLRARATAALSAPDKGAAEHLLREVLALYPEDFQSSFELGNLLVERGERREAVAAYQLSRRYTPVGNSLIGVLSRQIDALTNGSEVGPLRNPWLE